MSTIANKWFNSAMQGAPQMVNNFGDMVAVLDACLVNGFNLKTVTTLTRSGSTVNVYISAGHQFQVDQVIRSAGWDQAEYNGDFRVTYRDASNFQFTCVSTPATPGTAATAGTVKASPLDFQIAYTGTNKRAYRSLNSASPKPYLRVDNTQPAGWTTGKVICAKVSAGTTMSDVDTYSNQEYMPYSAAVTSFPDFGWFVWRQSYLASGNNAALYLHSNAGAAAANWTIVGDDRCFYFIVQGAGSGHVMYAFGDIESYKPGDQYGCFLWAHESYNMQNTLQPAEWAGVNGVGPRGSNYSCQLGPGQLLMKSYVGVGIPVPHGKFALGTTISSMDSGYNTGVKWPNGPDFSLIVHPSYCMEYGNHVRGRFPGLYAVHNDVAEQLADQSIFDNVAGLTGRKFLAQQLHASASSSGTSAIVDEARVVFDLTGPWR